MEPMLAAASQPSVSACLMESLVSSWPASLTGCERICRENLEAAFLFASGAGSLWPACFGDASEGRAVQIRAAGDARRGTIAACPARRRRPHPGGWSIAWRDAEYADRYAENIARS